MTGLVMFLAGLLIFLAWAVSLSRWTGQDVFGFFVGFIGAAFVLYGWDRLHE